MKISNYEHFWLFYVSEHLNPKTRVWHFVGTTGVLLLVLAAIFTGTWWLLILMPIVGYGPAWYSHFNIEKNRPATFKYPLWSLRADFRMYGMIVSGRMNAEVEKTKHWLANQ